MGRGVDSSRRGRGRGRPSRPRRLAVRRAAEADGGACAARGRTDYRSWTGGVGRSVEGGGIQTGGWSAGLDEVSQDLEELRGVGDDGDDFHRFVATRTAQRIRIVDLLDKASPCGPLRGPWAWMIVARSSWPGRAALLGRHGELALPLLGRADAERGFGGMVALPAPRRPAPRERAGRGEAYGTTLSARKRACRARGAAGARGVQTMGAEESASRVGQVLEDLDKKLDGGEDPCVGLGVVAVGSAIDDGVSASFERALHEPSQSRQPGTSMTVVPDGPRSRAGPWLTKKSHEGVVNASVSRARR